MLILRNAFHWNNMLFMYRFYQEANSTNIAVTQTSTDKRILFTMKREHIDRSQKFTKTIKLIEHIIELHPTLAYIILKTTVATTVEDVNNNFSFEYEFKVCSLIILLHFYYNIILILHSAVR
jgi:hypothetical protein